MIISVIACLLCTQADNNLYTKFVSKLRLASTVSGRVAETSISEHATYKSTVAFQYQLPNLMSYEVRTGKHLTLQMVSDEKTFWQYQAEPKHLLKQNNFPYFLMMNGCLVEPFLNLVHERKAPEFVAVSADESLTTFHGRKAQRVVLRREGKPIRPNSDPDEVYMDLKTGLPIAATLHPSIADITVKYVFEDLKIGKPIDHSVFEYKPQIAANPNAEDVLLPVGRKTPSFKGRVLGGRTFDLATEMKGAKAVILNFWGLGCPGCRSELPQLQELQNRFASQGLKVITDDAFDQDKDLLAFFKENHLSLTTVLRATCKPSAVEASYRGSDAEPITYLIDGKGVIVDRFIGDDLTELKKELAGMGFKD